MASIFHTANVNEPISVFPSCERSLCTTEHEVDKMFECFEMTRLASNSTAKAGFVIYHLFNKKISGDNTAFILSPLVTQSVANCLPTKNSTSFVSRPRFEAISRLLHPCM